MPDLLGSSGTLNGNSKMELRNTTTNSIEVRMTPGATAEAAKATENYSAFSRFLIPRL